MAVTRSQTATKRKHSAYVIIVIHLHRRSVPSVIVDPRPHSTSFWQYKDESNNILRFLSTEARVPTREAFPFLKLPSELRNQIYTLTLVQEAVLTPYRRVKGQWDAEQTSLAHVYRQIRTESIPAYFGCIKFA
ncbi:hypothetical protein BJ546DRAFT_952048 [Cryomyces antarcticus]